MSQHDYNIANSDGATVRADINSLAAAIQSSNASAAAPTATAGFMFFADSSANVMQVRNPGDSAFINLFQINASVITPYAGGVLLDAPAQTDIAQSFTKGQRGTPSSTAYASTVTFDFDNGNNFEVGTLTGNVTIANPTKAVPGQGGSFWLTQDGTGSRTVSFGGTFKFVGGSAPTASTASGAVDRVDYKVRSSAHIDAVMSLNVS